MGRIIVLILIVAAVWLVWRAFGPASWSDSRRDASSTPAIKGPDDDEEFLWNLEKQRFKERREREAREEAQRAAREQQEKWRRAHGDDASSPDSP